MSSSPTALPLSTPPTLAAAPSTGTRRAGSDAALLTAATYGAQALLFVAGLIQKAILGPTLAGYWALMQTFWTFFSIAPLGAQHGAARQIPMHRGREDFDAAGATASTAATFSFGAIGLLGVLVATVAVVLGGDWPEEMRWGLVLLGLTAPLRFLMDVHETIIQGVKRFDVESLTVLLQGAMTLVVTTAAVALLGFYGLFLGVTLMNLACFGLWLRLKVISPSQPAFRIAVDRTRLRELVHFGMPLLAYSQVWLLFQAVDSLIVAGALSVRDLGFYALAVSVTTYILYLPKSLGAALFPRMAETFGRTGQLASIHHYATDAQRLLAYVLIPLSVAGGFFLFPVLIRHFLPAFSPAIAVVQVMVAASFFMALMNMPIKVLLTAGYRWGLTGLLLLCLAVNAGLNLTAVAVLDLGLEGAAGATAISYLFTFLLTTGYSVSRVSGGGHTVRYVLEIVLVAAWTFAALRGLDALVGEASGGLVEDTALALLKLTLFAVVMTPWFWLAERRLQGLTRLRGMVAGLAKRLSGR